MVPLSAAGEAVPGEGFEARFGLGRGKILLLTWLGAGLILVFGVLLSIGPASHAIAFALLADEQGPVELLTFLSFAGAALLAARLGLEVRRSQADRWLWLGYMGFAAFCAFASSNSARNLGLLSIMIRSVMLSSKACATCGRSCS